MVNRYEGRLFVKDGRLCLVVEVDQASQTARVSCKVGEERQLLTVDLEEVAQALSAGGGELALDSLNAQQSSSRLQQKSDGWYFAAREGLQGPFSSEAQAQRMLEQHMLDGQSARSA